MKLKNIGEKVQGKLRELAEENKEITPEEIIIDQVIKPTKDEALSAEEIRKKQAENLVSALQDFPDMQKTLVQEAMKSDEISQAVIDTSAQIAAESSEVPDNVTGTLGKQASDDATVDILQNEGISSRAIRMEVINSLEDDEKKEDAICKELEELYKSLKDFQSQQDIVQKLQDCLEKVDIERTSKINEELYKIIAKVFAIQYCEFDGSIRISPMEEIVPIDEMIRAKMPQRVAEEYEDKRIVKSKPKEKKKLISNSGKKKPIDVGTVKQFLLNRMAKKVVGEEIKENRSDSVSIKNLGQLTDQAADGSIKISQREESEPIDEMIRAKMPQRVEEEYQDKRIVKSKPKEKKKLISNSGKKKPIDVETVKQFFLNRMAKKVVGEAIKENRSVSVFMKNLGQLTDQEASYLENEFINLGIETNEVDNIMRIARGEIEEIQEYMPGFKIRQKDKLDLGKNVEPKKAISESIKENKGVEKQKTKQKGSLDLSTLGTEEIKAIRDCIESGFIENLVKVPSTMRKKLLGTINHSLEQRTRKIVEMAEKSKIAKVEDTPKVKKAEWGDDPR